MRITGGKFRGRPLFSPSTNEIRPTSDQNRESVFNILVHTYQIYLEDAYVLDLCAGTGALGIESLSRGARGCIFIDTSAQARALIRSNVEAFGLQGQTYVLKRESQNLGKNATLPCCNLVFIDPPYNRTLAGKALLSAWEGGWIEQGALCILEESKKLISVVDDSFCFLEQRFYRETSIRFFKAPV